MVIAAACLLSLSVAALAQDTYPSADEQKPAAQKKLKPKPATEKPAPVKPALASLPPDTKLAPANDPLADVPSGERNAIRAALLWSSADEATPPGEDPITAAIKRYQGRIKSKVTGALTQSEREGLLAEAKAREDEFGWRVVTDPATGIRVGLPTKMVPRATEVPQGTRWSSRHGDVVVETFRIKTTEGIGVLFEQAKKEAARKVEYSLMRADNFIVSGLQGLKKFALRATMKNGELRGVTVSYDQAIEGIVAPVAVAMASAYAPFPERSAPLAALTKSVEYGTGLIVSDHGHIVTDRKLTEGCISLVASGIGSADRIAVDPQNALALIRVYGRSGLKPVSLAASTPANADDVTLVGIPDPHIQNGDKASSELRARLRDGGALELRQPLPIGGYSGAAALDKSGQVVPADAIRAFLARNNVAAPAAAGDARASVVRIICVRN